MRTNFAGLFLAVGMGLIVVLLGFGALSVAGLVSFAPDDALAEQTMPEEIGPGNAKADSAVVIPTSATATPMIGDAAAIANGDALFKSNCAQCHAVNEKVVGPALAGITKRRPIAWIVPWVQNSAKVVASGDEYAVKLFNDNGKQQMPSFPTLSKKDIEDIMAWATSQQGTAAEATSAVAYESRNVQ